MLENFDNNAYIQNNINISVYHIVVLTT